MLAGDHFNYTSGKTAAKLPRVRCEQVSSYTTDIYYRPAAYILMINDTEKADRADIRLSINHRVSLIMITVTLLFWSRFALEA